MCFLRSTWCHDVSYGQCWLNRATVPSLRACVFYDQLEAKNNVHLAQKKKKKSSVADSAKPNRCSVTPCHWGIRSRPPKKENSRWKNLPVWVSCSWPRQRVSQMRCSQRRRHQKETNIIVFTCVSITKNLVRQFMKKKHFCPARPVVRASSFTLSSAPRHPPPSRLPSSRVPSASSIS